jgi:hypothetical protein
MERIIMWSLERIIRKEVDRSIWRPGRKPVEMIIKRPAARGKWKGELLGDLWRGASKGQWR